MKVIITMLLGLFVINAHATGTACSSLNTQTQIARAAVKSLIALAHVPNVVAYYGGVQNDENGTTIVNVLPHFQSTKDWYKVSIRNSDCRVSDVSLFQEQLPIE